MKKIANLLPRLFPPMLGAVLGSVAVLLYIHLGIAHAAARLADPAVAGAPSIPGAGLDWNFWLAAIGAAAGLASLLLHKLAPKSKVTAEVDAMLAWWRSAAPQSAPQLTIAPPPRDKQAGRARLAAVTVLALIGCGAAVSTIATTSEHDLVNCTGSAIGTTPALDVATLVAVANLVTTERAKCTPAGGSLNWSCVETDLLGEGKTLGGCTLVALLTGTGAPAGAGSGAPASSATVRAVALGPDPGRAVLEDFRARVAGGATYHTANGDF